jgi:hypothetical protein
MHSSGGFAPLEMASGQPDSAQIEDWLPAEPGFMNIIKKPFFCPMDSLP